MLLHSMCTRDAVALPQIGNDLYFLLAKAYNITGKCKCVGEPRDVDYNINP